MKWAAEKPTTPGWYWWRAGGGSYPPLICWVSTESWTKNMPGEGEWAGPIPKPEESQIDWRHALGIEGPPTFEKVLLRYRALAKDCQSDVGRMEELEAAWEAAQHDLTSGPGEPFKRWMN